MADELNARESKLVQYLNEAYGKEKELESALQAHIKMAKRPPYKRRLQDHLKETKAQAKGLEKRIKALGGKAELPGAVPGPDAAVEAMTAVTAAATKTMAAAKGTAHAVRGTSETEKQLKNAKTELSNEHEEIANYIAIETFAEAVGDKETAKLARGFRRQEERMAAFLVKLLPQLAKAVAGEEVPAAERRARTGTSPSRSRSSRPASRASSRSGSRPAARSRSAASRSRSGS